MHLQGADSPLWRYLKTGMVWSALAFVCLLIGVAIPILPIQLTVIGAALLMAPFFVVVVWMLPAMKNDPARALKWMLLASMFLYCVWPRNVFIPLPGLPVKHPQKMLYFLTLAYAMYAFVKSAPVRDRLRTVWQSNRGMLGIAALFVAWSALTVAGSEQPVFSLFVWLQELLYVWALLPLLVIVLRSTNDLRHLILVFLAAAVVNVLYALPEVVWHRNIFESVTTLAEIDPAMARQLYAVKARGGAHRAQAAFDHPLLFAEFLAVLLPICLAALADPRLRKWALFTLPCLVVGLGLSASRVAAVASAVGVFVFLVFVILRNAVSANRSPWPLVLTLIAAPVILAAFPIFLGGMDALIQGRSATEQHSTLVRQQMLAEGLELIADSWVHGFGPGVGAMKLNFQSGEGVVTLDNYLLMLTLDSGLVGFAFFLTLVLFVANQLGALALRSETGLFGASLMGGLCAFLAVKTVLGTGLNNYLLPVFMVATVVMLNAAKHKEAA
jgi:O-Antigen ligase